MEIRQDGMFCAVAGRFYRAVDPAHAAASLQGSVRPGRYSAADQPTLYLSATPEGVEAAMIAHADARAPQVEILQVAVRAERILDLRDASACALAGISPADAAASWQGLVQSGQRPPSWDVRARAEALGAFGLIDPSRKAPGLWHLVLFGWNGPGLPEARLLGQVTEA